MTMRNQKKLMMKIMTTPYKAICKARDFYIRSITSCANNTAYGGCSTVTFGNQMSRSSSISSNVDEDLRELIRANSTASNNSNINRGDLELYIKQHQMMMISTSSSRRVPRSASVGMGRIDEDAPVSSFQDELDDDIVNRKVKSDHLVFPRSKSHALTTSKINRFS